MGLLSRAFKNVIKDVSKATDNLPTDNIITKPTVRSPATPVDVDDITIAKEMLGNKEAIDLWKKQNKVPKEESKRRKQRKFSEQAQDLQQGIMSGPEYRTYIKENQPATSFTYENLRTMLPSFRQVVGALTKDKSDSGILGLNTKLAKGKIVSSRLDIPAYNEHDVWVTSIVDKEKGKLYGRTAVLKNVNFDMTNRGAKKLALDIATEKKKTKKVLNKKTGKKVEEEYTQTKTPFATMKGEWQATSDKDAFALAEKYINDPDWVQVGFNPERHSFFYDKATMMPIFNADEVVQIGALVLAKVPKLNTPKLKAERIGKLRKLRIEGMPEGSKPTVFSEGGSVKKKPIDTGEKTVTGRIIWNDPEDGKDYSERSTTFKIDGKYYTMPTVAEDGTQYTDDQIRDYVKEHGPIDYLTGEELPEFRYREDALQYAVSRSETRKQKEEPMLQKQMLQFNEGGLNQEGGMVDEVSGNEVPMGSTREEVRDDIPAQVSEGEFIFPADVTRFIGLDKLMQLRQEAKMGLKKMDAMGQMGNSEEATMPDDMPFNMSDLMGAEAIVIEGRKKDDDEAAAIVAMAQGGVIYAQAGTSVPTTRSLAPVEQKPDYGAVSFNEVMGDGLQQTKVYVNKDGEKINVMFVGDNPLYPIPDGYTLFDPTAETTEDAATEIEDVVAAVTEKVRRISDRTPMKKTPFQEAGGWGMKFKDANGVVDSAKVKLWTDEYAKTSGRTPAVLTGIATVLGGPLGILVHLAGKGNAKNAAANYERVLKAAQQTNVEGQVKALQNINTEVIKGKEDEDKSILVKIIDGLKGALGFSDDEADEAVNVAGRASVETPEERAARLRAAEAAKKEGIASADALDQENTELNQMARERAAEANVKAFRDEEANLFTDQSMTVAEGEKLTTEATAATADANALKSAAGREKTAANVANEKVIADENAAARKAAAVERIQNTGLVNTIPGAAVAANTVAAPENPTVATADPNNLFSPKDQIDVAAGQLGLDINTIDNETLRNMQMVVPQIDAGGIDAAQAARIKKTVVGIPGKIAPIIPSVMKITTRLRQNKVFIALLTNTSTQACQYKVFLSCFLKLGWLISMIGLNDV